MSYSNSRNTNSRNTNSSNQRGGSNQSGRKPFCKVCFDAKKPQSVYESHFVKDREGKVTCVTLLEQECRYCYQPGHTVKFCPAVAANKAQKEKAENYQRRQQEAEERNKRQEKANAAAAAKAKMTSKGGFAALDCDSDDEEQKKTPIKAQKKEEFPALGAPSKLVTKSEKPSFASALQKNPVQVQKEREEEAAASSGFTVLSRNTDRTTKKQETKMPSSMPESALPIFSKPIKKIVNWAEDSDSDDEEFCAPNVTVRRPVSVYQPEEEYVDNSAW